MSLDTAAAERPAGEHPAPSSPPRGRPVRGEAAAAERPPGDRSPGLTIAGHASLLVLGVACIFPIYWLYATSLRRPEDIYELSPLPWPLSLDSYTGAFDKVDILRLLLNTFVVAAVVTIGQLLTALLAGYAFGMWRFPGRRLIYLLFVGTWLVPLQVTMLPNYELLFQLGLVNTLAGVIVPTLVSALGVLLLCQHMEAFPKELIEAATMDGRSSWSTLWTVVVPSLRPALAALAIVLFVTSWNEYFWPALVLQRDNAVVQLGIKSFMSTEGDDWGGLMATAGLTSLPVFVLYLVLRRHIVNAFVRSGIK